MGSFASLSRLLFFGGPPPMVPGQIPATPTNDQPGTGFVGESMIDTVLSTAALSLTTSTTRDVCTLTLTPGDWDVSGLVRVNPAALTILGTKTVAISTTSATLPNIDLFQDNQFGLTSLTGVAMNMVTPIVRVQVAAGNTQDVYLVLNVSFSISTATVSGRLRARRAR